jgi:shikimate 5-dehydrogenase/3-dehydroquinate dehydratase
MKLVVTIHEPTPERAIEAIRAVGARHDMIEVRVDAFGGAAVDLGAIRAATAKPIIATNRGGAPVDFATAYGAGIDFVDVELGHDPGPQRDRVVLSHHDFEATPDLEALARDMRALGCAHTKIAVTPHSFADNARVLAAIGPGLTLIGMGTRGLYSRILAPFFGSELAFVGSAAPGQFGLERALEIYGDAPARPEHIFAIAGNPASHSGSPAIHNRRFRERGVAAAYTIFESDDFLDIAEPFACGERFAPSGLSITAPFKEAALEFSARVGAAIAPNAAEARAANTLVRTRRGIIADNTDVDGFEALLAPMQPAHAALLGAGATARAALVALRRAGIETTVYNRTAGKLDARPLDTFQRRDGELVVNTLPIFRDDADINAVYRDIPTPNDGRALLHAQAVRQNALFLEVFS